MNLKSKYQQLKKQNFAKQQKIWNKHMDKIKHPNKAVHAKLDYASQLGRNNWRQTVAPPSMTRLQAMKQASQAFNNNVSLSGKLTVFALGLGLVLFITIGIIVAL